jgi:hypothetical protein
MDAISQDLSDFLVRLHQHPEKVSEKMEHYVKHILFLLPSEDESIVFSYYGIFGKPMSSLSVLASQFGISIAEMQIRIDNDLHHLAITPEWQMIRQLI